MTDCWRIANLTEQSIYTLDIDTLEEILEVKLTYILHTYMRLCVLQRTTSCNKSFALWMYCHLVKYLMQYPSLDSFQVLIRHNYTSAFLSMLLFNGEIGIVAIHVTHYKAQLRLTNPPLQHQKAAPESLNSNAAFAMTIPPETFRNARQRTIASRMQSTI